MKLAMTMTLTLMLALVGCGDDDGMTTPDTGPGVDAFTEDTGGEGPGTIAEIALADENFSTLVAAAIRAGLADTLASEGPFTVFAPTNAAFEASGITDVEAFTPEQLQQILLYHVLPGDVRAADIAAGPVDTAAELTLFLGTEGGVSINGGTAVTGGAGVAMADVVADNGVIHVIDRVLLPPTVASAAQYGGLTELLGAVGAAAPIAEDTTVADVLSGEGDMTVFAPTNAAFEAIADAVAELSAEQVRDVLLYHVVLGASVDAASVPDRADSALANEWGNNLTLLIDSSDGVAINGVPVVIADIKTTNGIVHVVDTVLLPPDAVDMVGIAGLTGLGGAVGAAADIDADTTVEAALRASAPYTIFAPTNEAFGRAPDGLDAETLRDVLLLHVVDAGAPVTSDGIPASAESLLGQDLTFDTAATPPTVTAPGGTTGEAAAPIVMTDVHVTNGVIHVIDEVLLPGS